MKIAFIKAGKLAGTLILAFTLAVWPHPAASQPAPDRMLKRMDANGDGKISRGKFRGRRRPFDSFDTDGDGFITRQEIETVFGGGARRRGTRGQKSSQRGRVGAKLDGQTTIDVLDEETLCGIGRGRRCDIKLAIKRGLFETGLKPIFPEGLDCHDIDESWAIDYTYKRPRENYHGGIDMPAPWGTSIIAAAAGTVVGKFRGEDTCAW